LSCVAGGRGVELAGEMYYLLVMFSPEEDDVDAMLLEFIADFGTEPKTEAMIENGELGVVLVY